MLHFLKPLFAALVGAAVTIFGALHSVTLWPAPAVWAAVAVVMPQLLQVVLFIACLALTGAGVTMIVTGIRAGRRRLAQLRHLELDEPDTTRDRFHDPQQQWA